MKYLKLYENFFIPNERYVEMICIKPYTETNYYHDKVNFNPGDKIVLNNYTANHPDYKEPKNPPIYSINGVIYTKFLNISKKDLSEYFKINI